ncbi:MAG: 4Fe-4S binding protein [Bacteroidota bacterium]
MPIGIEDTRYFQQAPGPVTLQYPHEQLPVPARGRYKLHNEIDDCIVCDKCAKVCPVDCIEIEAIKSPTPLGKTSNGMTKRLYAAQFDIDLAKCCFCGLCTTVCPTECLTMTPEYDYSVFDYAEHNVSFATMTPAEIQDRRQAWATHQPATQ